MSSGFPRPGTCERCTRDYTRNSARSKYCPECGPIATKERKRKAYLATAGQNRTRRNYNEGDDRDGAINIPYLDYDPDMVDDCIGCAFNGYCKQAVRVGDEVVCFPAHVNHKLFKEYK